MSLISDNIILGPNGRDFGTDAVEKKFRLQKNRILGLDGIKSVKVNMDIFPKKLQYMFLNLSV